MAQIECPRCSGPVTRMSGNSGAYGGGLVGVLLASAFAGFLCAKCGSIPRKEFPDEVRSGLAMRTAGMTLLALVVLGGAIALIVAINS
jgi:hypothetical protein